MPRDIKVVFCQLRQTTAGAAARRMSRKKPAPDLLTILLAPASEALFFERTCAARERAFRAYLHCKAVNQYVRARNAVRYPTPNFVKAALRVSIRTSPICAHRCKTTPSSVSPVVTKRQSAMSSLRASATIICIS